MPMRLLHEAARKRPRRPDSADGAASSSPMPSTPATAGATRPDTRRARAALHSSSDQAVVPARVKVDPSAMGRAARSANIFRNPTWKP
jgi:hypothetical protein